MRKLILISAMLLATAASAQAGDSRGLSLASSEPAKPIAEVSTQLAQAATAPAETSAPAQPTAATATEPKSELKASEIKATETKRAKPVKKVRRETDEQKARRIAAKYGVYW